MLTVLNSIIGSLGSSIIISDFISACKDSHKRARNMKLASIFLTESAVYFRGFFSKIATNEREIWSLLRYFLQQVQAVFEVYLKDTNKRAGNANLAFVLVTIWQLTQNFFVNVIPTERSDEGSLTRHTRYLPSGRYDTNAGYYSFGSTPIIITFIFDVRCAKIFRYNFVMLFSFVYFCRKWI